MTTPPPPVVFRARRIEPPEWAETTRTFSVAIPEEVKGRLAEQHEQVLGRVDETLRWAFSEPEPQRTFRYRLSMRDRMPEAYFIGRQHVDLGEKGEVVVETECCLVRAMPGREQVVMTRYTVTLEWRLDDADGEWRLLRELERVQGQLHRLHEVAGHSVLAEVELYRTGPSAFEDVMALPSSQVSPSAKAQLEGSWPEALDFIHESLQEELKDVWMDGELPFEALPSRLDMTGEYVIERVYAEDGSSDSCAFSVMIYTKARQRYAHQQDFDDLGFDLDVVMNEDGSFVCEGQTMSSISV